jgi:hypothetical protein
MLGRIKQWHLAVIGAVFIATTAATVFAAEIPAVPIQNQHDAQPVPNFIGGIATAKPVTAAAVPQNPFMAPNGRSNIHDDPYMTDTYVGGGPLGRNPTVRSSNLNGECGTVAFDSSGRLVSVCSGFLELKLVLVDPVSLATLASYQLPPKPFDPSNLSDFSGGGYFVLDHQDRAVIPTVTLQILVVGTVEGPSGPSFVLDRRYDLTGSVPSDDSIVSTLPDWSGRLWFVSSGGLVGAVDRESGVIKVRRLEGEKIGNSFSMDETGGVYIVSDHAMYRFDAASDGTPTVTWREAYDRGTRQKPGQTNFGSGTTPTLMGSDYVTIADNADPQMHVLVYRRQPTVSGPRLICSQGVFSPNLGATENSLIAAGNSIIVENNYGYSGLAATSLGRATEPGVSRVDLDEGGGCHTVWTSTERVPSVVSKLSLQNGLIYTYTKDPGPGTTDAWYFTAVDFQTGTTVFKQLAGTGFRFNNNYSAVYLGPDGTAYVGVIGGIVSIRDGEARQLFLPLLNRRSQN